MGSSGNIQSGSQMGPPSPSKNKSFDYTSLLAASAASQGISAVGGSIVQSNATQAQADYQKQMFGINSQLADLQAEDAISRGDKAAGGAIRKANAAASSSRAAAAAQGLDVNSGSALQTQTDDRAMGQLDALTLKNNAMREAFGYKSQAISYTGQGQMTGFAANNVSRNTLMTGGMRALGYGLDASYYAGGGGKNVDRGKV